MQSCYDNRVVFLHAAPDHDVLSASIPELVHKLPCNKDTTTSMSSDAFASVCGFRAMVLLTYEHLCGMRLCNNRPNCNCGFPPGHRIKMFRQECEKRRRQFWLYGCRMHFDRSSVIFRKLTCSCSVICSMRTSAYKLAWYLANDWGRWRCVC